MLKLLLVVLENLLFDCFTSIGRHDLSKVAKP
jgi:hypothetical protein